MSNVLSPRWALVAGSIVVVGLAELWVSWLALHPNVTPGYRAYYIDQTTTCLDKPVSGQYDLGETISFMPDDQAGARRLRICGWDGPAGDGTHSVGTSSMLRFALGKYAGPLVLDMSATAIAAPDKRTQQIALTANGVSIGSASIPDSQNRMVEFRVPASAVAAGNGALDVVINYPTATEMTPRDSITHYRSIKLQSVQLRRSSDAPSHGPSDDPEGWRHSGSATY